MTRVAIGLGSNLGNRAEVMRGAIRDLAVVGPVIATSSIYQTEPIGGPDGQSAYLNAVCLIDTDQRPNTILDMLQGIEQKWGRARLERWGPRTLDLDILLFSDRSESSDRLVVPHPRLTERRFVVEPLVEVWPDAAIDGRPVAEALAALGNQSVERLAGPQWTTMSDKGAAWVAGQGALLVLLLLSLVDEGSIPAGEWMQWVGRAFVVAAAVMFVSGMRALGRNLTGYPEPTTEGALVSHGVFRFIRHPLYGGNVLLILGIALHQRSIAGAAVSVAAAVFFWMKARHEEVRLSLRFPEYRRYMATTWGRLLPGL